MANKVINKIKIGDTVYDLLDARRGEFATQQDVADADATGISEYQTVLDDLKNNTEHYVNKIEEIKVNGTKVQPTGRVVDIAMPIVKGTHEYSARLKSSGNDLDASGLNSFAVGAATKATARESFAEGNNNRATGDFAHAAGTNTIASGNASFTTGQGTRATNNYEAAFGKYNDSQPGYLFSVGYGDSPASTKNAITVRANGQVEIPYLQDYATQAYVSNEISRQLGVSGADLNKMRAYLDAYQGSDFSEINAQFDNYQPINKKVQTIDRNASTSDKEQQYPSVAAILKLLNCTTDDIDTMFQTYFGSN